MSELKSAELRVGNWVQYDDGTIAKVYSVNGTRWEIGLEGFPQPLHISSIKPVELSEDILLKAGFALMSEEVKKELEIPPEDNSTLVYKDTAICCYWDGVEFVFKYGLDADLAFAACEFLHQLQNLMYCLLQQELPIQL